MMFIGISGSRGFIGSQLLKYFLNGKMEPRSLVAQDSAPTGGEMEPEVRFVPGDLSDIGVCREFVSGLDAIFHLAHVNTPLTSDADCAADAALNLTPLLNLIHAIQEAGRRPRVVYFSSGGAVYGHCEQRRARREEDPCLPGSSYGILKLAAEHYLRLASDKGLLRATILRPGNAYGRALPSGRAQGLIGVAVGNLRAGLPVRVFGSLDNVRDYVHVDDVCRACELALRAARRFDIFNIGTGEGHSVSEVLRMLSECLGTEIPIEQADAIAGAERLPDWIVLDSTKAGRELGWTPRVSLRSGIERMLREVAE